MARAQLEPSPAPTATPAAARAAPGGVEQVVVHGQALQELPDLASFATIVEVKEQPEEFKTVAQVLAESVGIQVRRFGSIGDFATVSIRGSSAGQVRIYLDDIPLTRARSETVNLSDLPLDPLQRIEIYRGVTPLSVGASALGGVINLVTKDPTTVPQASFLAGGGSFGTRKASVTASGRQENLGVLASFNYLGSQGDFPFFDDNGTPINPFDDGTVDRQNNAFNSGDTILKAIYDLSPDARIVGLNETFVNQQGVPGIGVFQSENANLFELRNLSYVRLETDQVSGLPLQFTGTAFFIYEEERFEDLLGEIGTGNQNTRNRTFSPGLTGYGIYPLGRHLLEGRLDFGSEIFVPRDELAEDPAGATQTRFTFDAGIGDTVGFFEDSLLLVGQLRYELAADDFSETVSPIGELVPESAGGTFQLFTPRLGVRYVALDEPELVLKTNVGRYGRIPNFFELFGNRGSVVGNPDLKPEQGVNVDAGFGIREPELGPLAALHGEAVFFWRTVEDLIVLVQNSQRTSVPRNISSADIYGVELSLSLHAWEWLGLTANYTYQNATDTSDIPSREGNQLPGIPRNEGYARVDYKQWDVVPFYELYFTSGNFVDQSNRREVPSRAISTLGLQYLLPWAPITLTFEAANITNNQVEDVAGFPLPGVSFFGTVAYQWNGAAT